MVNSDCTFIFQPPTLDIWQGNISRVNLTAYCNGSAYNEEYVYEVRTEPPGIAEVVGGDLFTVKTEQIASQHPISIRGLELGRTLLLFRSSNRSIIVPDIDSYQLAVIRPADTLDTAFLILLGCLIVLNNFGYGCKIQTRELWQIVKKPIAPFVGFCCQFFIMAPTAFGLAKLLELTDIRGLGLLAIGACPGGGGSNIFAYLLDADLELSILMTFVSTICALGMTPLWIWALGRFFTGDTFIGIPVVNVFASLASVVLPITLGVLFNIWKPRYGAMITKGLKPFIGVIGLVFIVMGSVVYYYALKRVTWRLLIACACLSAIGYFIGFLLGSLVLRNRKKAITISLETGFQNLALALMVLSVSLPQPESQLAGVIPIFYTFISASYPVIAFLIYFTCQKLRTDALKDSMTTEEEEEVTVPVPDISENTTAVIGVTESHPEWTEKVDGETSTFFSHTVA